MGGSNSSHLNVFLQLLRLLNKKKKDIKVILIQSIRFEYSVVILYDNFLFTLKKICLHIYFYLSILSHITHYSYCYNKNLIFKYTLFAVTVSRGVVDTKSLLRHRPRQFFAAVNRNHRRRFFAGYTNPPSHRAPEGLVDETSVIEDKR